MKNLTACVFGVLGLALWASAASAATILEVGSRDTLIGETTLPDSGDATELAWIADVLNMDEADLVYQKVPFSQADQGNTLWEEVTGEPLGEEWWAFDFGSLDPPLEPTWFLVKTGTPGDVDNSHYLYTNLDSLSWGVVARSDFGTTQQVTITILSHVAAVDGEEGGGGSGGTVPEPATLALFGLVAAGTAYRSRRRGTN